MVVSSVRAARNVAESVRASRIAVSRDWASGWSTTSTSTVHNATGTGVHQIQSHGDRDRLPQRRRSPSVTATASHESRPTTSEVTASDAALRTFLHGLPGVDAVGAEARAAMLGTRSIKTTAKA